MTEHKGGNGGEMRAAEAALQRMILRGGWIGKDLRAAIDAFGARLAHSVEPGGDPAKTIEWAGGNLLVAIANVDERTLELVRTEFNGALAAAGPDPRAEAARLGGAARGLVAAGFVDPRRGPTMAAARLVAGACAALALAELTSTDEAWLLARSKGEAAEHPDPTRVASYEGLERALGELPPESPDHDWQAAVWAKIDLERVRVLYAAVLGVDPAEVTASTGAIASGGSWAEVRGPGGAFEAASTSFEHRAARSLGVFVRSQAARRGPELAAAVAAFDAGGPPRGQR